MTYVSLLIAATLAAALALWSTPSAARSGKSGSHSHAASTSKSQKVAPGSVKGKGAPSKGSNGSTSGNNPSEHNVRGYTKKDGTHVDPHHATNPNSSKRDNYSSKGNANPHTGKSGKKDPDKP